MDLETDTKNIDKNNAKKEQEREEWSSGLDFFFSALGYAVGISNVWRFPYLCYKNGGGAFLIPYFTCMFVLGIPLVFLEFCVGQFTSCGLLSAYKMTRVSKGIGISMNIANFYLHVFYDMIVGYAIFFLINSFTTELPWQTCNPVWSSPNCVDDFSPSQYTYNPCNNSDIYYKCDVENTLNFGKCFNLSSTIGLDNICNQNETVLSKIGYWKTSFPSDDYWKKVVLKRTASIDESGEFVWQLVLSLFCAHLIITLMLIRGLEVSGKLVWFTAIFPYVVLLILGSRAAFLPGASLGVKYYITPNWSKITEISIWADAASQIFFSLTVSYGGMTTLAGYNKFNANIMRDAVIIPLVNCLTSFFAGFVIFAYMGYLSHITGQDIDNIIEAGQALAFVVYPFAVTTIPYGPVWAVLFFFMLILLGIDSTISNLTISLSSVVGIFPQLGKTQLRKSITLCAISLIFFLCGIVFTLQSGSYWLEIFNLYSGYWAVILLGFIECVTVVYFYGLGNFRKDITAMLGTKLTNKWIFSFWGLMWGFLCPILCFSLVIATFFNTENIRIGNYELPDWTFYLGQLITCSIIFLGVGLWGLYVTIKDTLIDKKPFKNLFQPDFERFTPRLESNQIISRQLRGDHKNEQINFTFENSSYCSSAYEERF